MIKLNTLPVKYFSQLDEDHMFSWAKQIACISSVETCYFYIDPEKADDMGLRDLLALCHRYGISIKPLSSLLNSSNTDWFKNPEAYWYESVFGSGE